MIDLNIDKREADALNATMTFNTCLYINQKFGWDPYGVNLKLEQDKIVLLLLLYYHFSEKFGFNVYKYKKIMQGIQRIFSDIVVEENGELRNRQALNLTKECIDCTSSIMAYTR